MEIVIGVLAIVGFIFAVYHVLNRKENYEYDEWLRGYNDALDDIVAYYRTWALLEYWRLEKEMPADTPYLKGYRDALLDKGILR